MRYSAYYVGLAGPDPVYGRQLGRMESWGAGGLDLDWAAASACRQTNLPQIRLEPILKRARRGAGARAGSASTPSSSTSSRTTTASPRRCATRRREPTTIVRARYLLACDGGRTVGRRLGVELRGRARRDAHRVRLHVRRPLALGARSRRAHPLALDPAPRHVLRRSCRWGPTTGARTPRSGSST